MLHTLHFIKEQHTWTIQNVAVFRNFVSCAISSRMDTWCSCSWNAVQMWKLNTRGVTESKWKNGRMTSEYTNRSLVANTSSIIHRRMRDLLRASPQVPTVGQNDELLPKFLTTMRCLSDEASQTSSRAKSGTHADGEQKEAERRSARAGGTERIKAYAICLFFPLVSKWISDLTLTPWPQHWAA